MKRELNQNLSGNEVYYTASSLLATLENSCSKLHHQQRFNVIPCSYKSRLSPWPNMASTFIIHPFRGTNLGGNRLYAGLLRIIRGIIRKSIIRGIFTNPEENLFFPVSAYVGSSKNLNDLKDYTRDYQCTCSSTIISVKVLIKTFPATKIATQMLYYY